MRPSPSALTLLAITAIASSATGPVAQSSAGWTAHNDAKGFSMSTPPGWNFVSDARAGRIVVQGPKGEQVVVWPASIQQSLDARGATAHRDPGPRTG